MQRARIYGVEFEGKIVYVGVTIQKNIMQRFAAHKSAAKTGSSGADLLGKWLLSEPIYSIKILEYSSLEDRFKRESFWISHYKTIENGFNRAVYKGGANNPFRGSLGRPKGCDNPRGKDHYKSLKVMHIPTGKIYGSMREAGEATGMSTATVCLHVNGKRQKIEFKRVE